MRIISFVVTAVGASLLALLTGGAKTHIGQQVVLRSNTSTSRPALPVVPVPVKAADKVAAKPKTIAERRYTPFEAAMFAATDIVAVEQLADPTIYHEDIVYLSLQNIPQAERKKYKAIADLILNSLNPKRRRIVRTATLPPTSDDPIVLRVNLTDYGINKKAWEDFVATGSGAVPLPEPYFYTRITQITPTVTEEKYTTTEEYWTTERVKVGYYANTNQPYYEERRIKKTREVEKIRSVTVPGKQTTVLATAPWVALETITPGSTIAALLSKTQNKFPIVRADWFITYASWAPAYYALLGLKLKPNPDKAAAKLKPKVFLEKDFEKIFDFNFNIAKTDIVAAITDTKIVTLHNRIVQRFSTVKGITGGYYWRSQDTDNGTDEEDYINQLAKFDKPKIKAQEIIASGRNGLNFYALTDAEGVLLNVAAASIAIHGDLMATKFQDKQVYAGRNCMLCHAGGQLFLKDRVRGIARGRIALLIADKTKDRAIAHKIEEAFSPDTKMIIDLDNAKFLSAVRAATGMDGKAAGAAFETIVHDYFDNPVTLDKMAREAGWETKQLEAALKRGINLDYSLTAVLQEPPEPVYRLTWERQGYASLMRYLLGVRSK